jgi:hypothetical protein
MIKENSIIKLSNPFLSINLPKINKDNLKTNVLTESELNALISSIVPEKNTEIEIQTKLRDKILISLHAQT